MIDIHAVYVFAQIMIAITIGFGYEGTSETRVVTIKLSKTNG